MKNNLINIREMIIYFKKLSDDQLKKKIIVNEDIVASLNACINDNSNKKKAIIKQNLFNSDEIFFFLESVDYCKSFVEMLFQKNNGYIDYFVKNNNDPKTIILSEMFEIFSFSNIEKI
jgi:hypothetical protein